MRIPIPVVFLLALTVAAGVWWWNTKHLDFVTPPSAEKLARVRLAVKSTLPLEEKLVAVVPPPPVAELPPPPPPQPEVPKPAVNVGDLTSPPTLQSYAEFTLDGTERMSEVATALEAQGEFLRALLAWERVIDLTKPDATQAATAISSIKRLRPTLPNWNSKPEAAIAITLHAGTGKKLAQTLTPVLEEVARDLEAASSGILKVKVAITIGKTSPPKRPAPVALWLSGTVKKPSSTETLSFTAETPELLRTRVLTTIFLLVRSQLSRTTAYTPLADLTANEDPQSALNFRITRLCWSEFAAGLNLPPKKKPQP